MTFPHKKENMENVISVKTPNPVSISNKSSVPNSMKISRTHLCKVF